MTDLQKVASLPQDQRKLLMPLVRTTRTFWIWAAIMAAIAVWGVAAYYSSFSNYKAARREWIEALVRSNPELVKDKVYRRITGEEKPE